MQVQPIINAVQAALAGQGSLAGGDVAVEEALDHLVAALGPAIRQAAMDLAEQAAVEVRAQLPDRTVDLVLSDGDPSLRIAEAVVPTEPNSSEELDARITLRVAPSLQDAHRRRRRGCRRVGQQLGARCAVASRSQAPQGQGFRMTHSFDL